MASKTSKSKPVEVNVDPADFKTAYLHVFDAFATDPATMEEETSFNLKYSRELLGALVGAGVVAITDVNEEGEDVWQTAQFSSDEKTHDEAEAWIDQWMKDNDIHAIPVKEPKAAKVDVGVHPCYCGCGEQVPGKSFYRPGHDARHAGVIGRLVASTGNKDHYNDLPSAKLTEKAQGIAAKTLEKQDAKRKAESEKAEAKREAAATKGKNVEPVAVHEVGEVKVGKGRFEARRNMKGGTVEYKSTDGEWKPASVTATKSFKAK